MKRSKLNLTILSTVIAMLFAGCTPSKHDGVQVGNSMDGKKLYVSALGYALEYSGKLRLKESPDKKQVTFENSGLTADTSQLIVSLVEGRLPKDRAELKIYVEKAHPGLSIVEYNKSGASGWMAETNEGSKQLKTYYAFLAGTKALIKGYLSAKPAGEGVSLLAPIMETLTADTTPPKFTSLTLPKELRAGKKAEFLIVAEDDLSGVSLANLWFVDTKRPSEAPRTQYLQIEGKLVPTGKPNEYRLEFTPGKYQVPGNYRFSGLSIADVAGNWLSVPKEKASGEIALFNDGKSDNIRPKLLAMTLPEKWIGGKINSLRFKATDDVSGIFVGKTKTTQIDLQIATDKGFTSLVSKEAEIKALGGDWYEMSFFVSYWQKGGEYRMEYFTFCDDAGNVTRIHLDRNDLERGTAEEKAYYQNGENRRSDVVEFAKPVRTTVADVHAGAYPKLTSIKVVSDRVRAGDNLIFEFTTSAPINDEIYAVASAESFVAQDQHLDVPFTAPKKVGPNTYRVEGKTSPWARRQEYCIGYFGLQTGPERFVSGALDLSSQFFTEGGPNARKDAERYSKVLPLVTFELVD